MRSSVGSVCVSMLVLIALARCETQPVTCAMPSVTKGQTTTLTCDFGTDMRKLKSNISVERGVGQSEDILKCYWKEEDYSCSVLNQQFSISTNISRYLKVFLPDVDETAEQQYLCTRHGHRDFPNVCQFTLKVSDEEDDLVAGVWRSATIALIVLFTLSVIALGVLLSCWCVPGAVRNQSNTG